MITVDEFVSSASVEPEFVAVRVLIDFGLS